MGDNLTPAITSLYARNEEVASSDATLQHPQMTDSSADLIGKRPQTPGRFNQLPTVGQATRLKNEE
jgi:hypothetical protein